MYKNTRPVQRYRGYPVNIGLGQAAVVRGEAYIQQRMGQANALFANKMTPVIDKLTKEMEKKVQQQVEASTAAILLLNAVPVVGSILSGLAMVASSLSGDRYANKTQDVLDDFKTYTTKLRENSKIKARDEITAIIKSVQSDAVTLALSNAIIPPPPPDEPAPVQGLGFGGIGTSIKKLGRGIDRAVHKIGREIGRPFEDAWKAIEKGLDVLSGKAAYEEAKKAAERGKEIASRTYKTAYKEIMAEVRSPQYKNDITIDLARSIRQDPEIQQLMQQRRASEQEALTAAMTLESSAAGRQRTQATYDRHLAEQADPSTKKIKMAPMAAAAVIPIAIALFS